MKTTSIATTLLAILGLSAAAPQWGGWGGWDSKDEDKPDNKYNGWGGKSDFTSEYHVVAYPDQVVNGTNPVPGEAGAMGYFNFGFDSKTNTVCYNIILVGVTGGYQSPARTATHIHQGNKGASGPPRIVFPDPVGDGKIRRSVGCMTGPFTTGVLSNGTDTGTGFTVSRIEANATNYYVDVHTMKYVPGAVRGQFA